MQIFIRAEGDLAEQELRSFFLWLKDDPDVTEHVTEIRIAPGEVADTDMGPSLEAIKLVTEIGFQGLNLALAYAAWRKTRTDQPKIRIRRGPTEITLSDSDLALTEEIVRLLEPERP